MIRSFFVMFFLLLSVNVIAGDLTIKLLQVSKPIILGAPAEIRAEVRNISGKSLAIAYGYQAFDVHFKYFDPNGNLVRSPLEESDKGIAGCRKEVISPDWKTFRSGSIPYGKIAGIWKVKAILTSHGPYFSFNKGEKVPFEAWEGEIESEELQVNVEQPTGIDKEAYDYFKGEPMSKPSALLSKYPTSTYTANLIYNSMAGFRNLVANEKNLDIFAYQVETDDFLPNSYPDETGERKDGWRSMKGKEAANWWAKWIDIILKNHPDIWFADELRLARTMVQIALKNYQEAEKQLKTLSSDPKFTLKEKAGLCLDLMKQKGWIKE